MNIKAAVTPIRTAGLIVLLINAHWSFGQAAPDSPDRPWRSPAGQQLARDAQRFRDSRLNIDLSKVYSLAELIDFAEAHHPLTRVAWENASAQAAAFGVARSELYPTLAAVAFSGVTRDAVPFGTAFFLQTLPAFEATFDLQYTVFDFGARDGRIAAAGARALAANFGFNDAHRKVINQVEQAYYRLLNFVGAGAGCTGKSCQRADRTRCCRRTFETWSRDLARCIRSAKRNCTSSI